MKEKYNLLHKQQEELRIQLIADLQKYSEELLHKKPSPGAWSVADIIAHLIAGEEYVFNYISKKIKDGSRSAKTGRLARIKRDILKIAFALPIKFKVPKSVVPSTEYATLKELDSKWERISKARHELINSLDESEFHKDIWHHPRVGKINFVQMIDFSIDHSKRHEGQIKRILSALQNKA
jgi:uncharacterized damage-inducible protein DinB